MGRPPLLMFEIFHTFSFFQKKIALKQNFFCRQMPREVWLLPSLWLRSSLDMLFLIGDLSFLLSWILFSNHHLDRFVLKSGEGGKTSGKLEVIFFFLWQILCQHIVSGCVGWMAGKLCEAKLFAQVNTLTSHYNKETGATIRGVDNPGMEKTEWNKIGNSVLEIKYVFVLHFISISFSCLCNKSKIKRWKRIQCLNNGQ